VRVVRIATYVIVGLALVLFALDLSHTLKPKPTPEHDGKVSFGEQPNESTSDYVARLRTEASKRKLYWQIFCRGSSVEDGFMGYVSDDMSLQTKNPYWDAEGPTQEIVAQKLAMRLQGPPNVTPKPACPKKLFGGPGYE
jgi:hypothetical protein